MKECHWGKMIFTANENFLPVNAARPAVEGAYNLTLKTTLDKSLNEENQPMSVRRWSKQAFTPSASRLIDGSGIPCICCAGKQWAGLIHLGISCKWGEVAATWEKQFSAFQNASHSRNKLFAEAAPITHRRRYSFISGARSSPLLSCLGEKKQITCSRNRHYPLLEKPTSTSLISACTGNTCQVCVS